MKFSEKLACASFSVTVALVAGCSGSSPSAVNSSVLPSSLAASKPSGVAATKRRTIVESVLYGFHGSTDGGRPLGSVVVDAAGNVYGTTSKAYPDNQGTAFKLTPKPSGGYSFNLLYTFQSGPNGANPIAGLTADGTGAFYGTTAYGGSSQGPCGSSGCGTVFKLTPSGSTYTESVVYAFLGGSDGWGPYGAGVTIAKDGAIYGTTNAGGGSGCGGAGCGTVFKLTPNGSGYSEKVLYAFQNGIDGANPTASVTVDRSTVFGTTNAGGGTCGCGIAFKLTRTKAGSYKETILHSFQNGSDGAYPYGALIKQAGGVLYGTTTQGGGVLNCAQGYQGCGTVYALTPASSGKYTESIVYSFKNSPDGANPYGNLIANKKGALFGTTWIGGSASCNAYTGAACGTVYELVPAGSHTYSERVLYSFRFGSDGANPYAGVFLHNHTLFGTTYIGGGQSSGGGAGTVFAVKL